MSGNSSSGQRTQFQRSSASRLVNGLLDVEQPMQQQLAAEFSATRIRIPSARSSDDQLSSWPLELGHNNTNSTASTIYSDATQSSMAKIIDIQRTKRHKGDNSRASGGADDNRQPTTVEWNHHDHEPWLMAAATAATVDDDQRRNNVRNSVPSTSSYQQQQQQTLATGDQTGNTLAGAGANSRTWTPNARPTASQKQQSGETLSSFESDYDLLVYLGETETEDIVDTERSLDYQDQTWRQSICGGASLAPTIDESLSELIGGGGGYNPATIGGRGGDFDLLNTPNSLNSPFASPSPPRSISSHQLVLPATGRGNASPAAAAAVTVTTPRSPSGAQAQWLRAPAAAQGGRHLNADLVDDCDNEVASLLFNQAHNSRSSNSTAAGAVAAQPPSKRTVAGRRQQPTTSQVSSSPQVERIEQAKQQQQQQSVIKLSNFQQHNQQQQQQQQPQQQGQKLGNIGNKLVSLFNRKQPPPPPVNQTAARRQPLDADGNSESATSAFVQGSSKKPPAQVSRVDELARNATKSRTLATPLRSSALKGEDDFSSSMFGGGRRDVRSPGSGSHLNSPPMSDAAELDRLLAEMSQSLDLDSLARYDPYPVRPGRAPVGASSGSGGRSATLSKFQQQAATMNPMPPPHQSNHQSMMAVGGGSGAGRPSPLESQPSQRGRQPQREWRSQSSSIDKPQEPPLRPPPPQQSFTSAASVPMAAPYANATTLRTKTNQQQVSSESILDEYDGASRMLEQMISDQLEETSLTRRQNNHNHRQPQQQPRRTRNYSQRSLQSSQSVESAGCESPSLLNNSNAQQTTGSSVNNKHSALRPLAEVTATTTTTVEPARKDSNSSVIYRGSPVAMSAAATSGADKSHHDHNEVASSSLPPEEEQPPATRKLSTSCSSSVATETSMVLATRVGELPQDKRDQFENRSVWRHGGGGASGAGCQRHGSLRGESSTTPTTASDGSPASRAKLFAVSRQATSLDQQQPHQQQRPARFVGGGSGQSGQKERHRWQRQQQQQEQPQQQQRSSAQSVSQPGSSISRQSSSLTFDDEELASQQQQQQQQVTGAHLAVPPAAVAHSATPQQHQQHPPAALAAPNASGTTKLALGPNDSSSSTPLSSNIRRQRQDSASDLSSQPPVPPEVDYGDDDDDQDVIRVEPAEVPLSGSDDDDATAADRRRAGHKQQQPISSQMDRMKRRTLSSMRSMRNKLSDFVGAVGGGAGDRHHRGSSASNNSSRRQSDTIHTSKRSQQQEAVVAEVPARTATPVPPKRASSVGSRDRGSSTNNNNNTRQTSTPPAVQPTPTDGGGGPVRPSRSVGGRQQPQERESRRDRDLRERNGQQQQQSFGQLVRERLSKSKSRLGRLLRPGGGAAKRAQSTPNAAERQQQQHERLQVDGGEEARRRDRDLVEPGDIARNFEPLGQGGVAAAAPIVARRKSSSSSSEGMSNLSGLDTSAAAHRSRSKRRRKSKHDNAGNSNSNNNREPRSSSLLSIKRLSSSLKRSSNNNREPATSGALGEDLDTMKVSTSNELPQNNAPGAKGPRKRGGRRRGAAGGKGKPSSPQVGRRRDDSSSGGTQPPSPVVSTKVATTNEYFGQVAPAKADSSSPTSHLEAAAATTTANAGGHFSPSPPPQPTKNSFGLRNERAASSALKRSTEAEEAAERGKPSTKKPNRSQSLKSVAVARPSDRVAPADDDDEPARINNNRTVSFSNLLNRRAHPSSTHTFRPASACAQLERGSAPTVGPHQQQDHQPTSGESDITSDAKRTVLAPAVSVQAARDDVVVTPIGPVQPSRFEALEVGGGELPPGHRQQRGHASPMRAKSATMLNDIRAKCSELFGSPSARRRRDVSPAMQTRPPSPPPSPPVRPPRRFTPRRAKSVAAEPRGLQDNNDDGDDDDGNDQFGATASTLNRQPGPLPPTPAQSAGKKLATLAQQLRHSAADFFQQGDPASRRSRAHDRKIVAVEVDVPAQRHASSAVNLCEWKPVINSSNNNKSLASGHQQQQQQRAASSRRSFKFAGSKGADDATVDDQDEQQRAALPPPPPLTTQRQHSPDTDSTWEPSDEEEANKKQQQQQQKKKDNDNERLIVRPMKDDKSDSSAVAAAAAPTEAQNDDDSGNDDDELEPVDLQSNGGGKLSRRRLLADERGGEVAQSTGEAAGRGGGSGCGLLLLPHARDGNSTASAAAAAQQLAATGPEEETRQPSGVAARAGELGGADNDEPLNSDEQRRQRQQQHRQQQQQQLQQVVDAISLKSDFKQTPSPPSEHKPPPPHHHLHSSTRRQEVCAADVDSRRHDSDNAADHDLHHHSEQKIVVCKTPFKFNANLPSPSELRRNQQQQQQQEKPQQHQRSHEAANKHQQQQQSAKREARAKEEGDQEAQPRAQSTGSKRQEGASDRDETDKDTEALVESLVRSDANLAALLAVEYPQTASRVRPERLQTGELATFVAARPAQPREPAGGPKQPAASNAGKMDEADAQFLKAISHKKQPSTVATAIQQSRQQRPPQPQPSGPGQQVSSDVSPAAARGEEQEEGANNRLSIYENVSSGGAVQPLRNDRDDDHAETKQSTNSGQETPGKPERQWRRAPWPPEKPAHLLMVAGQKAVSTMAAAHSGGGGGGGDSSSSGTNGNNNGSGNANDTTNSTDSTPSSAKWSLDEEDTMPFRAATRAGATAVIVSPNKTPTNDDLINVDDDIKRENLEAAGGRAAAAKPPTGEEGGPMRERQEAQQQQQQQREDVAPAKPKRKLVTMTSIIQDPNDQLMMVGAQSSHRDSPSPDNGQRTNNGDNKGQQQGSAEKSGSRERLVLVRQESTTSFGGASNNNNYSDDNSDSSGFAAAATSRRRLVNKFRQLAPEPATTADKRPPLPAPFSDQGKTTLARSSTTGSSLVKRLAKNYDMTVQQQDQAGGGRPPLPNKPHQLRAAMSVDEDPRSESTWYDAKSMEMLDEAEVAEFLQEFDNDNQPGGSGGGGGRPTSEAASVSTGADPFVTVADSTLGDDGDAPSSGRAEADDGAGCGGSGEATLDEDDTLNDDDDDQLDGDDEEEDDGDDNSNVLMLSAANDSELSATESYVSTATDAAATNAAAPTTTTSGQTAVGDQGMRAPPGRPGNQPPGRQHDRQEQGKDNTNQKMLQANDAQLPSREACVGARVDDSGAGAAVREDDCVSEKKSQRPIESEKSARAKASFPAKNNNADNNNDDAHDDADNDDDDDDVDESISNTAPEQHESSSSSPPPPPLSPHEQQQQTTTTNCAGHMIDNKFKNSLNRIIARRSTPPQLQVAAADSAPLPPPAARPTTTKGSSFKARRNSSMSSVGSSVERKDSRRDSNNNNSASSKDNQKKAAKLKGSPSRSKELKGLSKYIYHAFLKQGSRSKRNKLAAAEQQTSADCATAASRKSSGKRTAPIIDDYIHSSSSSSASSSSSSCASSDDEDDTTTAATTTTTTSSSSNNNNNTDDKLEVDDKKLVRAAKKCSRLYEELEKILAHRAAREQLRRQAATDAVAAAAATSNMSSAQADATHGASTGGKGTAVVGGAKPVISVIGDDQSDDEEEEGDFALDYYDECSVSTMTEERDDQISLSSSNSLSSESIPEIKQRHNLQKLYHVVNEIHASEAKFVDTLRLLNEDFRQHILQAPPVKSVAVGGSTTTTTAASSSSTSSSGGSNSNSSGSIPPDCLSSMLKHLPQLQALNENLLGELKLARDQWPKTQKIAHVLVKIGPFLKHYSTYIREFESIQQQLGESMKKYPQFAERVKEFEASERSQKLTIQHHLLKPIQRIPQYRLLLQQYLHHLKPDDVDYEDTVNALEVVSRVAEHANQSMSEGANFAKLLALQAKIVGKQKAKIVRPGRLFVKEGELMKVCRKQVQPRWFILLNDALLYLTQIQSSDILYLNNELPLDDCLVSTPSESKQANLIGQQFETEFSVCTRARSFALIAKSRAERDEWVRVFRQTIDEHQARRRSFSIRQPSAGLSPAAPERPATSGDRVQSSEGAEPSAAEGGPAAAANGNGGRRPDSASLLGSKAPLWTPDSRVTMCQLCTSSFSALFRRHHCRACGRVVCSACSSNKAPLIYLKCRAARVCDECFDVLRANIHLYCLPSGAGGAGAHLLATAGHPQLNVSEQELRQLDEHFQTLLKSQFVRHAGLHGLRLARNSSSGSSGSGGKLRTTGAASSAPGDSSGSTAAAAAEATGRKVARVLKEVGANDSGSIISGYLHRRHPTKAKWKRQWFVIKDKVLYAYRAIDDVAAISSLPLLGFSAEQPTEPIDGLEPRSLLRLRHTSDYQRCSKKGSAAAATAASTAGAETSTTTPATTSASAAAAASSAPKRKISSKDKPPIEHLFKAESVGAAERWLEAFKKSVVLDDDGGSLTADGAANERERSHTHT